VIAAELAQDGDHFRDFLIRVVDDEGNEVVRLPVVTGFGTLLVEQRRRLLERQRGEPSASGTGSRLRP
jgi:hypothetical protein